MNIHEIRGSDADTFSALQAQVSTMHMSSDFEPSFLFMHPFSQCFINLCTVNIRNGSRWPRSSDLAEAGGGSLSLQNPVESLNTGWCHLESFCFTPPSFS